MVKSALVTLLIILALLGTGFYLLKNKNLSSPLNYPMQTVPSNASLPPQGQPGNEISLEITSPANGSMVSTPTVLVTGKTSPGAEVSVNEVDAKADANGNFSVSLTLDEGENTIDVTANDAFGKYTQKELIVTYLVPGK